MIYDLLQLSKEQYLELSIEDVNQCLNAQYKIIMNLPKGNKKYCEDYILLIYNSTRKLLEQITFYTQDIKPVVYIEPNEEMYSISYDKISDETNKRLLIEKFLSKFYSKYSGYYSNLKNQFKDLDSIEVIDLDKLKQIEAEKEEQNYNSFLIKEFQTTLNVSIGKQIRSILKVSSLLKEDIFSNIKQNISKNIELNHFNQIFRKLFITGYIVLNSEKLYEWA